MDTFIWNNLVLIFPGVLLFFCYITGDLARLILKTDRGICIKVLSGFVILLCLFHLASLPFMFLDWSFTTLYYIFIGILIAVPAAYLILSVIRKQIPFWEDLRRLGRVLLRRIEGRWWLLLLWAAILFLIIWHVRMVILHIRFNVDDNFYVAESLTILTRDRLMDVLPSCGIEGSVFPATYILVSWEALLSAFSKLFAVSPAALCHSILPALLLPLHYMAYYAAGREIVKNRACIFLTFVLFLNFVCGPSTYNQGAFLTLRIWQGKSVLVNILLPILLYVFLRITKKRKITLSNLLFLFAILLASQAATTVGAYLPPVLYAVYALTFLLLTRRWSPFWKLFLPAAGIVPFVLWKVWILLNAGTLGDLSEGSGVYDRSFSELAMNYFGFSLIIVFFLLSLLILALRLKTGEEKQLRFFFPIASLLLMVFFLNPLVMPYVERFVTGVGVYWRMFWLLQISVITAAAFTLLTEIPRRAVPRTTVFLFLILMILISGRSIFKDEDYREEFKNPEKVSMTTKKMIAAVRKEEKEAHPERSAEERRKAEQDLILLLPRSLSLELRQCADMGLLYYAYYSNNYYAYQTDEEYYLLKTLYGELYNAKKWTAAKLDEYTETLGIDYVAIGRDTADRNQDNIPEDFQLVHQGSRYNLYKTK